MIVGMSDIQQGTRSVNPAKDAGLKIGDILVSINGNTLTCNNDVATHVSASGGSAVSIGVLRGGTAMEVSLQPIKTASDDKYKAGIWVRDSSAGIGTLTYYDPATMGFAGLGHAICDVDTGKMMPLSSGEIVGVNISGVHAGQSGSPGELRGTFTDDNAMGHLTCNSEMGIFGVLNYPCIESAAIPMAHMQEVQPGPATILATISGSYPQEFEIVIDKINYMDATATKNMVIRITDSRLLGSTGGIVQGMSGSPIIQNDMLVGAVTHVFVNDPTRGYAIFAEKMDSQLETVEFSGKAA
jgi:stage IV sporulation protein B